MKYLLWLFWSTLVMMGLFNVNYICVMWLEWRNRDKKDPQV